MEKNYTSCVYISIFFLVLEIPVDKKSLDALQDRYIIFYTFIFKIPLLLVQSQSNPFHNTLLSYDVLSRKLYFIAGQITVEEIIFTADFILRLNVPVYIS
jgi:hypothetical protein